MADKKFYLKERGGEWEEISVEISPVLAQTLDETIDNITVSLALNTREQPYAPNKTEVELVQVYDDDSTETINKFIVSADNVTLETQNPLRYKHSLTLVQRAQNLTKKEMRNTVFSTSLETSIFSLRSARTYYLTNPTCQFVFIAGWRPDNLALRTSGTTVYTELSTGTVGKIDLSKKKINRIRYKKVLMAQIIKKDEPQQPISTTESELPPGGENQWAAIHAVFDVVEPNSLNTLLENQNESDRIEPSLTIEVRDSNNNSLIDSRTVMLGFDDFNNGIERELPESIYVWLRSFNDGIANFIYNISINTDYTTWNDRRLELNKIPFFYTSYIDFNISSIESSCYDVIQTLLNQQLKETANYNRTNDPHCVPLFKLPDENHNPELYELLTKTSAPNFVFTQGNMYECLVEIFKLFDAIFTIDNDGYLDIEYYNVHKKIEFTDNKKAGRVSSLGEERYANRLISYFQNTKINDRFPNSNQENATAYLRSKTIGVPGLSDFVFMVPKPIDIINQVLLGGVGFSITLKENIDFNGGYYTIVYHNDHPVVVYVEGTFKKSSSYRLVDITSFINEESVWSVLSESTTFPIGGDYSKVGKNNSFVYRRGANYISVSNYYQDTTDIRQRVLDNVIDCSLKTMFGLAQNYDDSIIKISTVSGVTWRQVKLFVSYIALTDGRIVNESIDYKYDGGIIINQNNGSIDINKLGLNMVGLSLKLGQPTLTMTQKICKWEDRVKKGEFFIKDGEKWVANTCSYTLINKDLIEASIEFVKNFNGLASRIELNREKRLSNISNELTVKCEENYGEYIYYNSRRTLNPLTEKISLNYVSVYNQIAMGFGLTVPSTKLGDYEDMSSKMNNVSIATLKNTTNYTNQTLEKVTGFVESQDTDDYLILNETSAFNGERVTIPLCSYDFEAIYWDLLNDGFIYNENVQQAHPFQGLRITVWVLKIGNEIIGGVIRDDFNNNYFYNVIPENQNTIEYASLTAYDENDNVIQEDEYSADHIAIPMVVYGSGNSVCFEMSFDSPIAAGTQLLQNYTSAYGVTGWFSKYVLYTSKAGEATKFTIDFIMLQEELTRQFPKFTKSDGTPLATFSFGAIEELAYYKKPNEIFALNYQLHFMPDNGLVNDYLANEYIKNNAFSNGINKKQFHIMYSKDENFAFSIFDVKATEDDGLTRLDPSSASAIINQPTFRPYLEIAFSGYGVITSDEFNQIKAWALCDDDNNIYFSSNVPPKDNELGISFRIYFYCRHHRKEE